MPNIASLLKEEIARLSRKEHRASTETLKRTIATFRSEIAALKRRVQALERQARRRERDVSHGAPSESAESGGTHRWSAKGLAKHRARLGLSAADFGALLGVSALTVYKWESVQARPRARYLTAIAAVRAMGKREATKRLEELAP